MTTFPGSLRLILWLLAISPLLALHGAIIAPSLTHPPAQQAEGVFWRTHWYDREAFTPKIGYTRRARINAANAVLDPRWGIRTETRENGLLLITTEEDLFQVRAAELYAELWGGHPGTANKRFTVNGRSFYQLPHSGTEAGHCTYSYPTTALQISDLVNGINAIQWNVDPGTTFWGHAMIDNAAIRFALTNTHPDLVTFGLSGFQANVVVDAKPAREEIELSLNFSPEFEKSIASVEYEAWYRGYDENGNRHQRDWHSFTQHRRRRGHLGTTRETPFNLTWDTSMIPAQKNVSVRAIVHFKEDTNLSFVTSAIAGHSIADRPGVAVHLYEPADLPASFWSRDDRAVTCHITLDEAPDQIERAELYVISWTGGPGNIQNYFTLNGTHYPIAEGHQHEIQFNRLKVDPTHLHRGSNAIRLHSDTKHHGIEIIYPGPALMVRYRF